MYRIVLHRRATRYLKKQPRDQKERLKKRLRQLREDPGSAPGTKPMHGEWHGYRRLRVGDLRVVYTVNHDDRTVFVSLIAPRGDAYR